MALSDSLISYWPLDEASGNAIDAHSTNDLTDNNTVGSATGKVNNGRDFERDNQEYFSHASNAELTCGDIDFTFAFWVKFESSSADASLVTKDSDAGSSRDYTIDHGITSSVRRLRFYFNGGTGIVEWGSAVSDGTWYYVVAWHDAAANTNNIQVNNGTPVSAATGGAVPQTSAAQFQIGRRQYSSVPDYSDAVIDEVGFWKRVLTADERTDLYNGGNGRSYDYIINGDGDATPRCWQQYRQRRVA